MSGSPEFQPTDPRTAVLRELETVVREFETGQKQRTLDVVAATDRLLGDASSPVLAGLSAEIDPVLKPVIRQARWEKTKAQATKIGFPAIAAVGVCVALVITADRASDWLDSLTQGLRMMPRG